MLRLLHPVHVVDARAVSRCLDEARALLYPPHPGIVAVEDAGQLPDGRIFLVAEDSELPQHVDLHPHPGPDDLVRLAEEVAPALDALHARGLLHGHLDVDAFVGAPALLTGVGFGVFQGGTTQEWTGGRDPGRRVDQGLLGRLLLALAGEGAEWTGIRAVLERCISVDDALPFPSVAVLARALRGACVTDPTGRDPPRARSAPGAGGPRAGERPVDRRALPRPGAPRRGRDGPGVPRRARRPRGGAQAASPRAPAFAPPARPVLPRGAGGEPDPPPAHRRGDRGRRGARVPRGSSGRTA